MDAATLPDTDELLLPVAQTIWDMKYRFKERDGTPVDLTMDDTRRRVAGFLARNDTEKVTTCPRYQLPSSRQSTAFSCRAMVIATSGLYPSAAMVWR